MNGHHSPRQVVFAFEWAGQRRLFVPHGWHSRGHHTSCLPAGGFLHSLATRGLLTWLVTLEVFPSSTAAQLSHAMRVGRHSL